MYVSCGFDELYGARGYANDADLDALGDRVDRDPARFGIHRLARLFDSESYEWRDIAAAVREPTEFAHNLREFYHNHRFRKITPSLIVRIDDALLTGSVLLARKDGQAAVVYETHRQCDRVDTSLPNDAQLAAIDDHSFADPDTLYLLMNATGSFNYGHWLVDDLPKIRAALELGTLSPRRIVFLLATYGETIDAVRRQSLNLLLPAAEVAFFDRGRSYVIRNLHYATPVSFHPMAKHPTALRTTAVIARYQMQVARSAQDAPRKLFVTRSNSDSRRLLNGDAIADELGRRGFVLIEPAKLGFVEQIRAFSRAEQIVGLMGAAMTNSLFSPPGCSVTYLVPEGWIEPFYIDLATICEHRYRALYGSIADQRQPAHLSDYTVPVEDVLAALDATERG